VEAEAAVLGACIVEAVLQGSFNAASQVLTVLEPEQFHSLSHQRVYRAMQTLVSEGKPPTPQLLAEDLKREGFYESVGGVAELMKLTIGVPQELNLTHYLDAIQETAERRDLIRFSSRLINSAMEGFDRSADLIAGASEELFRLGVTRRLTSREAENYSQVAGKVIELFNEWERGNTVALPTQIPELDDRLKNGGLSAGDLTVVAARTSFGKSALALQIALSLARTGVAVKIFSLEMSDISLFIRNLASTSGVPHYRISPKTFQYNQGIAQIVRNAVPEIAKLPISVDHTTRKLQRLLASARAWSRNVGKNTRKLLITDYMQLVDNKLERRSRNDEVAGISMELKGLATELEMPVIGVSQLTRSPAKDNRRPELSDLRESGQLEQDADLVLFPWSEDGIKDERIRGMKLYCPKQRGGQVGWEIPIDFDGDRQWFFTERMYAQERGEIAAAIDFNSWET